MDYNQPLDQPSNPDAPYKDGNAALGIQPSIIPAGALEYDQREVVEVINRANTRAYIDFTDAPCAPAADTDLMQLRKAIEGYIRAWDFLIDSEITFRVHGPNADFPDLLAAVLYLGKYRITPQGHVILQLSGATPLQGIAEQFVYNQTVVFNHPNNDRISVLGATMLAALPYDDSGYACNGPSAAARAADINTNTGILRQKFATELHFVLSTIPPSHYTPGNVGIQVSGLALMDLDSIMVTGDLNLGACFLFNCRGYTNYQTHHGGLAAIGAYAVTYPYGFGGVGFMFDVGACMAIQGEGFSIEKLTTLVSVGAAWVGVWCLNGAFITGWGNIVSINGGTGYMSLSRSGTQWDGGMYLNSNANSGFYGGYSESNYMNGTMVNGVVSTPSHFWKNGGWGANCVFCNLYCNADMGGGTANANAAGTVYAAWVSSVNCAGHEASVAGYCSPALYTPGNYNSMID